MQLPAMILKGNISESPFGERCAESLPVLVCVPAPSDAAAWSHNSSHTQSCSLFSFLCVLWLVRLLR